VKADAQYLPFRTGSFTKAICHHTLEHIDDVERSLDEMLRVTKRALEITVPYRFSFTAHGKQHKHVFTSKWFRNYAEKNALQYRGRITIDPERTFYMIPLQLQVFIWKRTAK